MGKSPCCEKVGLRKGKWTTEEDETFNQTGKVLGNLYLKMLIAMDKLLKRRFEKRWSMIASHLSGRTDNEIKNYWNSHLSRQSYRFFTNKNKTKTSIDIATLDNQQKRRVGQVSRCVAKKYNNKPLSATNKSTDKQVDEKVEDCSNFVTKHMKESQVHGKVISGELESMHSGGVSSTTVEDQIEQWLTEVEAENLEENERKVDEREESLSLDSTKTWISCYNETEWDTEFDFTGLNTCDGEDDMLVWLWED